MIKKVAFGCALIVCLGLSNANAADVKVQYTVQDAFAFEKVSSMFSGGTAFYWGNQPHPPVVKKFGTYKTSKRTNALGKDQGYACAWAMASALSALRDRAQREGGNAVINIVSNIKDVEESSETAYSCLAGKVMVNVALKGTVVSLGN